MPQNYYRKRVNTSTGNTMSWQLERYLSVKNESTMTQWRIRLLLLIFALRCTTSSLPVALLDALSDFAFNQIAFQRAEVLNKQLAVQMVGFMFHTPRFQVHNIKRKFAAVNIL